MKNINPSEIEDLEISKSRLNRRILDLENRLSNHRNWTSGEKEIFIMQIKAAKNKLIELGRNN